MTFYVQFLGSGAGLNTGKDNYQSNLIINKNNKILLIDGGTDLRFSLTDQQFNFQDIQHMYVTHLHADHIGGLEWLSVNTYFNQVNRKKPHLYGNIDIINQLWRNSLSGGLLTLEDQEASLETYFQVHAIPEGGGFEWEKLHFQLIQATHVLSCHVPMPCYGLFIDDHLGHKIYFTADTQFMPKNALSYYQAANIIFQDCETIPQKTGVHAHYLELRTLPADIKNKMWLYHYNAGELPDAVADGFLGFVEKGQTFHFD